MKKVLVIAMSAIMVFALAACGGSSGSDEKKTGIDAPVYTLEGEMSLGKMPEDYKAIEYDKIVELYNTLKTKSMTYDEIVKIAGGDGVYCKAADKTENGSEEKWFAWFAKSKYDATVGLGIQFKRNEGSSDEWKSYMYMADGSFDL